MKIYKALKTIVPVIVFASLLVAIQKLLGTTDDYMNYAFFGAIGGFLGGDAVEGAIHGQWGQVMNPLNAAMDRLYSEYDADREQWTSGFAELETQFRDLSQSARTTMTESHAAELGYLSQGREDALQQIRQAGSRRRSQALGANIQSGLANTTFGQGMLGAIDASTGQQAAGLETMYSQNLAGTTARHGQETTAFDQWSSTGLTELGRTNVAGMSALSSGWMNQIMQGENMRAGYRARYADALVGNEANNMSMGMNFVGGLLGGLGA